MIERSTRADSSCIANESACNRYDGMADAFMTDDLLESS